jgi:hypothetical protein
MRLGLSVARWSTTSPRRCRKLLVPNRAPSEHQCVWSGDRLFDRLRGGGDRWRAGLLSGNALSELARPFKGTRER